MDKMHVLSLRLEELNAGKRSDVSEACTSVDVSELILESRWT